MDLEKAHYASDALDVVITYGLNRFSARRWFDVTLAVYLD